LILIQIPPGRHSPATVTITVMPIDQLDCRGKPIALARLRRLADQLHALGPRPIFEYLREIIAGADPAARLERYAELDPDVVRALGGDRLPPAHRVVGGRP
jgi:hypothetical protein